jgi:hypothetical protein
MGDHSIDAMIELQRIMANVASDAASILGESKPVIISVEEDTEEKREARRTLAQNRLIYLMYKRIGKTLYGNDESHARNECKLRIGCRILYRDSKSFAKTFDDVIRPLSHELRMTAMNILPVSSIFKVKQSTEYIKTIMTEYSALGVYFLDLEGAADYMNYPESKK